MTDIEDFKLFINAIYTTDLLLNKDVYKPHFNQFTTGARIKYKNFTINFYEKNITVNVKDVTEQIINKLKIKYFSCIIENQSSQYSRYLSYNKYKKIHIYYITYKDIDKLKEVI